MEMVHPCGMTRLPAGRSAVGALGSAFSNTLPCQSGTGLFWICEYTPLEPEFSKGTYCCHAFIEYVWYVLVPETGAGENPFTWKPRGGPNLSPSLKKISTPNPSIGTASSGLVPPQRTHCHSPPTLGGGGAVCTAGG